MYAWGNNGNGQLGNGNGTITMPARPVNAIFPFGVSLVSVASGAGHHLVLGSEGQICAWGANVGGELGDGTTIGRSTPVLLSAETTRSALVRRFGWRLLVDLSIRSVLLVPAFFRESWKKTFKEFLTTYPVDNEGRAKHQDPKRERNINALIGQEKKASKLVQRKHKSGRSDKDGHKAKKHGPFSVGQTASWGTQR
ncbi:MAG: hypothetical protein QFE16_05385 [Pseudomonadota bacterium]|nr:hypothetical protein [Pseudomonadota bacterium]